MLLYLNVLRECVTSSTRKSREDLVSITNLYSKTTFRVRDRDIERILRSETRLLLTVCRPFSTCGLSNVGLKVLII